MATDHASGTTRTALYTDLFDTLASHRNATHAHHMAEALVRRSRTERQLVGLVDDCRRAVFFAQAERSLVAYAFDKHGVAETETASQWRVLGDAASWVDAHSEQVDWVHPEFRGC